MKKVNELRAGALLSYVNIAITTIIPLLYTPIMLKMLGQSEYGLYSLSNSIISYLSILNFGMGSAVVRYITAARAEENKDKVTRTTQTPKNSQAKKILNQDGKEQSSE